MLRPERGMLTNVTFPDLCIDVPIRGSWSVRKKFCTISGRHWSATETGRVGLATISKGTLHRMNVHF